MRSECKWREEDLQRVHLGARGMRDGEQLSSSVQASFPSHLQRRQCRLPQLAVGLPQEPGQLRQHGGQHCRR